MSEEFDRKLMPGFMQSAFSIWMGAMFKSVEMMKHPQNSMEKMATSMKTLVTMPDDAGDGLQKKAQAMAAVWMQEGATLIEECRSAGEKFTNGK